MLKKIILFLIISFLIGTQFCIAKDSELHCGMLKYKISGTYENGIQIVYFQGSKYLKHKTTEYSFGGSITLNDTLEIDDGNFFYSIDLINKTGTKIPYEKIIPTDKVEDENIKNITKNITKKFFKDMQITLDSINIQKSDTVTFFGKQCKIIKSSFYKTYLWKDLILRQEITSPYKSVLEVTDMKINTKIPDSMFQAPIDVKVQTISMKNFAEKIKSMLPKKTIKTEQGK